MDPFATSHLSDDVLLRDAPRLLAQRSKTSAILLTRLAEIDERKLYRRAGYPSMYAYCIGELHLLEDAACRQIHVARLVRQFPAVLIALAEDRVSMRAVLMLARHLTPANADELMVAITHKSRFEVQGVLAERFPQPDLPERLQAITQPTSVIAAAPPVPERVDLSAPERIPMTIPEQPGREHIVLPTQEPPRPLAPVRIELPVPAQRVTPLSPQRFAFQCTLDQETHDLLQEVRALMSHEVPTGEMALVLKGALKLAKAQLEKRKFATTDRPGHARPIASARHIPAAVKRAVWERDEGRCAFVSESGRRCRERAGLEYDHAEPVARGGQATVENVRLVCRAHNQHEAERTFGLEFMERKRAEARRRHAEKANRGAPAG